MSGFYTDLPRILRRVGIDVYVMPGAETRTSRASGFTVNGVVWHHTATSKAWLDGHVAALLRDGRRDLSGPLSQVGVERDGTWVIVALGRANHNGYGTYVPGWDWGNDSLGLEFFNDGVGEPFTKAQMESGIEGTRAVLLDKGLSHEQVAGHKETDPDRKIDPTFDMTVVRNALAVPPTPAPPPPEDDDDMPIILSAKGRTTRLWSDAIFIAADPLTIWNFAVAGAQLARWNDGEAFVWPQKMIDRVPRRTD